MTSCRRLLLAGVLSLIPGAALASAETCKGAGAGPAGVYAKVPARDDRGRDQIAMFCEWNPDPIGNHEANLGALAPALEKLVRKVQADNPGLRFVVGSGRRDRAAQRKARAWGWSRTTGGPHGSGNAVDLWPLDPDGRVVFDRALHARIGAAMKKAAADLKLQVRWGGNFRSFADGDPSHFELVSGSTAPVRTGAAGPLP